MIVYPRFIYSKYIQQKKENRICQSLTCNQANCTVENGKKRWSNKLSRRWMLPWITNILFDDNYFVLRLFVILLMIKLQSGNKYAVFSFFDFSRCFTWKYIDKSEYRECKWKPTRKKNWRNKMCILCPVGILLAQPYHISIPCRRIFYSISQTHNIQALKLNTFKIEFQLNPFSRRSYYIHTK